MIYLLCGVPGSGKTWVASQLSHKFKYIPQDDYQLPALIRAGVASDRDFPRTIIDCPFNEREVRRQFEAQGCKVTPIFIIEKPEIIRLRYLKRTGRLPAGNVMTRAITIREKADEWNAHYGTSSEILEYLSKV